MRAEFARHAKPYVWTSRAREVLNGFADRVELAAARESSTGQKGAFYFPGDGAPAGAATEPRQ